MKSALLFLFVFALPWCSGAVDNANPYAGFVELYEKILKQQEAERARIAKEESERKKAYEAEQRALKSEFGFAFSEVMENLVVITHDAGSGSGCVVSMGGRRYILTNQHVILGANKLQFKTLGGEVLIPKKVELAEARDIARLMLDDGEGLAVTAVPSMDVPIAVFGNSEGAGVATELYGRISGIGADIVEVTADFVKGNSGSPVLNRNREVVGIASYVVFSPGRKDTQGTRFEKKTRRFCYRIDGIEWNEIDWRKYNESHGKPYVEVLRFVEGIQTIISSTSMFPPQLMSASISSDPVLGKWIADYNAAVKDFGESPNRFLFKYGKAMEELSALSTKRAWQIRTTLKQKRLVGFVSIDLERHAAFLESVATHLDQRFKED